MGQALQAHRYTGDFNIVSYRGQKVAQLRLTNRAVAMAPKSEQGVQPYDRFRMDERFGRSAAAVKFNVMNDIRGITERDADVIVEAWEALKTEI